MLPKLSPFNFKWIKYSTVHHCELMAKDHLIFGDGNFLIFLNLNNGQQKFYKANNEVTGDGVRYVAGHKSYYMFAFAEKCYNPRIIIMTYPDFGRVMTLSDGQRYGYLKLAFSEGIYFVSLSTFPEYNIIVWNWRTGEKFSSIKTNILTNNQMIRLLLNNTTLHIAQMSTVSNQLSVWVLLACCKKSILKETKIEHEKLAYFCECFWTSEGTLFSVDNMANVYMLNAKYALETIIHCEEIGPHTPKLVWYKHGLVLFGPKLKLQHYKKSGNWSLHWEVECPEAFKRLIPTNKDLICISETNNIYAFNSNDNTFNEIISHQGGLNDVCMVYPMGTRIVTLCHGNELSLWELHSGKLLDSVPLEGKALCLKENPEYPYVAVSFQHGLLMLMSIYDVDKLTFLTSFYLTRNPLSSIYFAEVGKRLVTADMNDGQFFIINGHPGGKMEVIATVTAEKQIADYILVASKTCLRLFAIVVTSNSYIAGNKIIRYCIVDKQHPEYKEYMLEESGMLYSKLHATKLSNRDRVFYATPLTTKCIHQLETKRGDDYARVIRTIQTNHQMKKILYHVDNYNTISYAYDGLVFIYNDFLETVYHVISSHHRMDCGIAKAYVDPHSKYVVSLNRRNTLICSSIDDIKIDHAKSDKLSQLHFSEMNQLLFKYPTIGFIPKGDLADKTWLEVEEINLRERERKICEHERNDILRKFNLLKSHLQLLLTANIEGPENEILDIQKFNIDIELKNEKLTKSKLDCEKTREYMLALIVAQDKVTKFIKTFCLDPMNVAGQEIYAMYENYSVTNYTLLSENVYTLEKVPTLTAFRTIESFVASKDIFKPWIPLNPNDLKEQLAQPPCLNVEETAENLFQIEEEDEEEDEADTTKLMIRAAENLNANLGNEAHNYIELCPLNYDQFEVQTFDQTEIQKAVTNLDIYNCKLHFNKQFNVLRSIKEREMYTIKEYTQKLRHIISEINYFSKNKLQVIINDPEVHQKEYPERILEVLDQEVSITPYISPSEQGRLDAEAAEAERIRLLLLADDFRERALMTMMNGVLEVRWEDELRKDVPKPKCLIEKQPENYSEDDIRAVLQYENDVTFLHSERERYKVLLETDYGKVTLNVRESVKKINARIDELFLLKLKIDSAINQFRLRMFIKSWNYFQQIIILRQERDLEKQIHNIEREIEKNQKLIANLYETLNETRGHYDALMGKEKILEKNLKKDFSETSPLVQDQVQKLYKKRPKTNIRTLFSPTLFFILARSIVTLDRPRVLNVECLDFLKAADTLDLYVGISNAIDETNYALLCKHRRLRIENELKMKGLFVDISDGETTIALFQKIVSDLKEKHADMINEVTELRAKKLYETQNFQIQLVMRGGLVEVPLTGYLSDFRDAILVPRKEVEVINKLILDAGKKKIKVMEDVMKFKRGISSKEWEHALLKRRIVDLEEVLYRQIGVMKVTKEIQAYLRAKLRGDKEEKITFEQELEYQKKLYERTIDEMKDKVKELEEKICSIKKDNRVLDKRIADVNVDLSEYKLDFDHELEQNEREMQKLRMSTLLKRARLVKEIQSNHNEILVLQTELEILRLKTFPTLKYKLFN